jgi:predicted transcriptional regulator
MEVAPANSIADLRATLELTLEGMGGLVGISKSQMHEVERTGRASLRVALRIEELSGGAIDAADLCDDVRAARAVLPVASGGAEA